MEAQQLLFRCEPYPGEHPASWLLRLSWRNGFVTGTKLAAYCFGAGRVPAAAKLYSPEPMQHLARMAGYAPEVADRVGPTAAEVALGALIDEYPVSRWHLRITAAAGSRHHPREQPIGICRACLAQDQDPHWRRDWALATTFRCARHGELMDDRCPHCGIRLAISLHRRRGLTECDVCGKSLLSLVKSRKRPERTFDYPYLPGAFESDVTALPFGLVSEHLLWDGIWWLLGHLCSKVAGAASIAQAAALRYPEQCAVPPAPMGAAGSFGDRDPAEREVLLDLVEWMLGDWPDRATRVLLASKLSRTAFSSRAEDIGTRMPFWLEDVVDASLNLRPYRPCREEVEAAAAYLAKMRRAPPSRKQLKQLLGVTESIEVAKALPVANELLTPEHALRLLSEMDGMIAAAPRARAQRDSVARDCVLIAICLAGSLKLCDAIDLTRGEVQELLEAQRTAPKRWRRTLHRFALKWEPELRYVSAKPEPAAAGDQPAFVTRFGMKYLGNTVPGRTVSLLQSIEFGAPNRGIGVAKDLKGQ